MQSKVPSKVTGLPRPTTLLAVVVGLTFLVSDIVMSIAGRDGLVIGHIPFLVLPIAGLAYLGVLGIDFWLILRAIRTSAGWITLVLFAVLTLHTAGGYLAYNVFSDRSTNEADALLRSFVDEPQRFQAHFAKGTNAESVRRVADYKRVYESHPFGRYVYVSSEKAPGQQLAIQLTKTRPSPLFQVFRLEDYSGPNG